MFKKRYFLQRKRRGPHTNQMIREFVQRFQATSDLLSFRSSNLYGHGNRNLKETASFLFNLHKTWSRFRRRLRWRIHWFFLGQPFLLPSLSAPNSCAPSYASSSFFHLLADDVQNARPLIEKCHFFPLARLQRNVITDKFPFVLLPRDRFFWGVSRLVPLLPSCQVSTFFASLTKKIRVWIWK